MYLSLFFLTLLLVACVPFGAYELIRWGECKQRCHLLHDENENLLHSKGCSDAEERRRLGNKMDAACQKAQHENIISAEQCTWVTYWAEGALYKLWGMVAHSHWMLWGIIVPVVLFVLFLVYKERSSLREERKQDKLLAIMEKMANNRIEEPRVMREEPRLRYQHDDYYPAQQRRQNGISLLPYSNSVH